MWIALDLAGKEAPVEGVTAIAVPSVEGPRICVIEEEHPLREVCLRELDHEVDVIRHQAPGDTTPLELASGDVEQANVEAFVSIVEDDGQLARSADSDVVVGTCLLSALRYGHRAQGREASTESDPAALFRDEVVAPASRTRRQPR